MSTTPLNSACNLPYYATQQGRMAGLWSAHREIGMPFDISLLMCRENDIEPDWLEALAVAIQHGELAALDAACGGIPDIVKVIWCGAAKRYGSDENAAAKIIESRKSK